MADIVVKKGSGTVKTKVEVLGGAQAITSSILWILEGVHPDHFEQVRQIKNPADSEGPLYVVGNDLDLDNKFLEWVWTATPAPGSSPSQGTVRITLQQGGSDVDGFPLSKLFDFSAGGPVTFSLTGHLRVAP